MDKLRSSPYVDVFRARAGELVSSLPDTPSRKPTMPEKETSSIRPFDMNMQNLLKYLKEVEKVYERAKVQEARQKVHKFRMTIKSLQQLAHKRPELFIEKDSFGFCLNTVTNNIDSSEEHQQSEENTPMRVKGASIIATPETPENKAVGQGGHQGNHKTSDNEQGSPLVRSTIPMRNAKRQPSYLDQVQPMVARDTPYAGKFSFAPVNESLSTCFEFGAKQDLHIKGNDQEAISTPSKAQDLPVFAIEESLRDSAEEKIFEQPIIEHSMSGPTTHAAGVSEHNAVPDSSHEACEKISLEQEYTLGHVFVWSQQPVPNGDEDVQVDDQTVLRESSHSSRDNISLKWEYTLGHVFIWSQQPIPNGDEEHSATAQLFEGATEPANDIPTHSPVCDSTEQTTPDPDSHIVPESFTLSCGEDISLRNEAAQDPATATTVELATYYEHTGQPSVEELLNTEAILSILPPMADAVTDCDNGIPQNNQVVDDGTYLSADPTGQNEYAFQEVGDASGLDALFDSSDAEEYLANALSENCMLDENDLVADDSPLLDNCKVNELLDVEEETLRMAAQAFLPPSPVAVNTFGVGDADDDNLSDSDESLIIITETAPFEEVEVSPVTELATAVTHQSPFTSTTEEYALRHVFPHTGDQAPPEGNTVSIADHDLYETPDSPAASAGSTLLDDQSPKNAKYEDALAVSTAHPDPEEVYEDEASKISVQAETVSIPNSPTSTSERNEEFGVDDVPKESISDIIENITDIVLEETEAASADNQSSIAYGADLERDGIELVVDVLETPLQKSTDVTDVLVKDKVQPTSITSVPITRHVCITLACTTMASLFVGLKSPATAALMMYAGIAYAKYNLHH
ncbi:hypothetical protein RBB50_002684 [Rhinocladiella similis]